MSLINDYTISQLHAQRSAELRAEADQDRLARIARAGRPRWWQRGRSTAPVSPAHPGRRRPATHRVA